MASLATVLGFFGATWWGWDRIADWRFPLLVILVVTSIVYGFVFRRAVSAVFLLAAIVNAVLARSAVALDTGRSPNRATGSGSSASTPAAPATTGTPSLTWIHSVEADVALLYRTTGDWTDTLATVGVPYRVVPAAVGSDALGQAIVLVRGDIAVTPLDPVPGSDVTLLVDLGATQATLVGLAVQNPGSTFVADQRIAQVHLDQRRGGGIRRTGRGSRQSRNVSLVTRVRRDRRRA